MNFAVLGAGAIGSVFGGLLARAGHRVALVGRQAHLDVIARHGLRIDGIWGEHRIKNLGLYATAEQIPEQERAACDAALVTVKSYDTEDMMRVCAPLFPTTTAFVSLQNGLGNIECIAGLAGSNRVIGGRVIFGVVFVDNGHVRVTVEADRTALGIPVVGIADRTAAENLAREFSAAGIGCVVTDAIEQLLWGKMLYNCSLNAPATILGTTYGSLLFCGLQDLMRSIIGEIFAVARCCGVDLPWPDPEDYARTLFNELIPLTSDHLPSMLQDINRGKRTEIDALNGAIVRLAREYDCPVPCNDVLVKMIRSLEIIHSQSNAAESAGS